MQPVSGGSEDAVADSVGVDDAGHKGDVEKAAEWVARI